MNNNLNNISLGSFYSKRIAIKRYYLKKQHIQKESIFVFARVLSTFYLDSFSSYKSNIKGELKFDAYSYADGYVLEIYFEQIDSKIVDRFMNISRFKIDSFVSNLIENKFNEVPYIIVTSKEKALADYRKINLSSLDLLLSYSGIKYSYPVLDVNLINSTTYAEIERTLSIIKTKARVQDIIIDKNHSILSYNTNKKSVDVYPFNYNLETKDIYNNCGKSSLGYIFEFNEIKSLKDYSSLSIIFDRFKEVIGKSLYSLYQLECQIDYFDISKIRGMVVFTLSISDVLSKKELIEREITRFFSNDISIDNNLIQLEKLKGTKLLTSHKDAIRRIKVIQDNAFKVDYDSFFYNYQISKEDIFDIFYSIKMIKNFNCFDDRNV